MPYRPERPVSIAAIWSRRLGIFALALAAVAFLLHRLDILSVSNAVAVILLAAVIALFAVGLAMIGFTMLWLSGAEGGRASFVGLVVALLVLGPVGFGAAQYLLLPAIHDISTDPVDAPTWLEPPRPERSWMPRRPEPTGEARQAQASAYPRLTGRRYEGAIDRVLEAVSALAIERKWVLVDKAGADFLNPDIAAPQEEKADAGPSAPPGTIPIPEPRPVVTEGLANVTAPVVLLQFSWRSPILGLDHDILLRLIEEEETTFVDMRAATRAGQHDLGTNSALVQEFLRALDVALLGIAGS